jgi:hypothetical protein
MTKYYSHEQIKQDEMGVHVARMGYNRNAYRNLVDKLEAKNRLEEIGVD